MVRHGRTAAITTTTTTMQSKLEQHFTELADKFNTGKATLEEVFEQAAILAPAARLQAIIRGTNNGYIFAPAPGELAIANTFPHFFHVRKTKGTFPWNITLAE